MHERAAARGTSPCAASARRPSSRRCRASARGSRRSIASGSGTLSGDALISCRQITSGSSPSIQCDDLRGPRADAVDVPGRDLHWSAHRPLARARSSLRLRERHGNARARSSSPNSSESGGRSRGLNTWPRYGTDSATRSVSLARPSTGSAGIHETSAAPSISTSTSSG